MKGKRQKKRSSELTVDTELSHIQQAIPLRIRFNLCQDNIACFVGQKKNTGKNSQKTNKGIVKGKLSLPTEEFEPQLDATSERKVAKTQSEQIVQGSLNSILSEIQAKGIDCEWKDQKDQTPENSQQAIDPQNLQLWNAFSVNSSFSKSYASTIDVQPINYYNNTNFNTNNYYYDYRYKQYDDGSFFTVIPEYIASDSRTTIMIRNIPNKYTIKELSEEIDRELANTYDFLYLPCDIKNQCNVGYGFINFLNTSYLEEFYQRFQGQKWCKFRSEKICNLTYARLQGLASLIEHFQNSKVQKDKRYRPIIREYSQISQLIRSQQLL